MIIHKTKNMLIEFNGYYTHNKKEEIGRKKHFKQNGYDTLILHYGDFKNESLLIQKIKNFYEVKHGT